MKRVVLFAPYFLPRRRVSSMRPFRFALHLREFGWSPTVITLETPGARLTAKEAQLLEGVEVVALPVPMDRTSRAESQLQAQPRPARKQAAWLRALDRQVPVDTWLPAFALNHRRIMRILDRVRPEALWTTGDPWSGLVYSARLRALTHVPWVADFRDPWTLCQVRPQGQWAASKAVDRWAERYVLRHADAVTFTAETTEAKYRAHYADLLPPTATITNSYASLVFEAPVATAQAVPPTLPGDTLRIGFFGRFRELSPATLIIDVLAEARARHGEAAAGLEVGMFGRLNAEDAAYAEQRGVADHFVLQEAVPLEKALTALRVFDLLLVTTALGRDEIIPAKLFEYLATGRPILSLTQNPEVARILATTGTGVQYAPTDLARIADLLVSTLQAKQQQQPLPFSFAPDTDALRRFEARSTTQALAAVLERVSVARSART